MSKSSRSELNTRLTRYPRRPRIDRNYNSYNSYNSLSNVRPRSIRRSAQLDFIPGCRIVRASYRSKL